MCICFISGHRPGTVSELTSTNAKKQSDKDFHYGASSDLPLPLCVSLACHCTVCAEYIFQRRNPSEHFVTLVHQNRAIAIAHELESQEAKRRKLRRKNGCRSESQFDFADH